MAESYLEISGYSLELEASQFALVFASFHYLLENQLSELVVSPGIADLKSAIRENNLLRDWYHVFRLDPFLREESDHDGLQKLIATSTRRISNVGCECGVPTSFYEKLGGAFAPPFPDRSHWCAVAWPFVQVASVALRNERRQEPWTCFLKGLGC